MFSAIAFFVFLLYKPVVVLGEGNGNPCSTQFTPSTTGDGPNRCFNGNFGGVFFIRTDSRIPPGTEGIGLNIAQCYRAEAVDNTIRVYGPTCDQISGGFFWFCTECISNRSTRHLMNTSPSKIEENTQEYHTLVETCFDEEYEVSLHVDEHFYAIAIPTDESSQCPSIVTHARYKGLQDSHYDKEILLYSNKQDIDFFLKQALPMGTFQASELVQAHQDIDPASSSGGAYDIVTNNCADYMIALASKLGVNVDTKVKSFVARRLLQSGGKGLVDKLRQSASYVKSLTDMRGLRQSQNADERVLQQVIEMRIAGMVEN